MITILTDSLLNWLTYDFALGGTVTGCDLIREYETPTAVRICGADYFASVGKLNAEQADRLSRPNVSRAREIMAVCREFNWQILTPDHPCYPLQLLRLPDFPIVLYASGNTELGKRLSMNAIVGTRRASDRALDYAYRLAAFFSENGVVTVSGCAVGVDSAAHEGALTAGGSTVGVLGNGFGYNYLPDQVFLRRRIRKYGLLLTETPPFQAPQSYSFQRRNRLIAGLAYSVTVVESGNKGGSLITAGYAKKQQKRLFVPAREALASPGCDGLLQKGASELRDIADAIYVFHGQTVLYPDVPLTQPLPPAPCLRPAALSLEEFARHNEVLPVEAAAVFGQLSERAKKAQPDPTLREKQTPRDLFHLVASGTEAPPPAAEEAAKRPLPSEKAPPAGSSEGKAPGKTAERATPKAAKPPAPKKAEPQKPQPALSGLPEDARRLYDALGEEPALLDEIADSLGFTGAALMTAVSLLELKSLIRTFPGNLASRA